MEESRNTDGIFVDGIPLATKLAKEEEKEQDRDIAETRGEDLKRPSYHRPQRTGYKDEGEKNGDCMILPQSQINSEYVEQFIKDGGTVSRRVLAWLLSGRTGSCAGMAQEISTITGINEKAGTISSSISHLAASDFGPFIIKKKGKVPQYSLVAEALMLTIDQACQIYDKRNRSVTWDNVEEVFPFLKPFTKEQKMPTESDKKRKRSEEEWRTVRMSLEVTADRVDDIHSYVMGDEISARQVQRIYNKMKTLGFGKPSELNPVTAESYLTTVEANIEDIAVAFQGDEVIQGKIKSIGEMLAKNSLIPVETPTELDLAEAFDTLLLMMNSAARKQLLSILFNNVLDPGKGNNIKVTLGG